MSRAAVSPTVTRRASPQSSPNGGDLRRCASDEKEQSAARKHQHAGRPLRRSAERLATRRFERRSGPPLSRPTDTELRVSSRRTLPPGALSTAVSVSPSVDAVAGAGHRGDDPGFAEAFAQCRDRDAHGVGDRVGVLIPCPFQELFGADDAAFGSDEDFEHGELFAGERDVAAVAVDLAYRLEHGRPDDTLCLVTNAAVSLRRARLLDGEDRTIYALAVYAGLRRGEALGLTWVDVDLGRGVIRV